MRALPVTVLAACGLLASACGGGDAGGSAAGQAAPAAAPKQAASPSSPARETPKAKPLDGKVIVIDPGHNGANYRHPREINRKVDIGTKKKECDTTGTATNSGYSEAAYTWDVSKRMVKILERRGATVKLTRDDNNGVGPCIDERAAIGNRAKADAAISVHADGSNNTSHRGFHIIMPKKIDGPVDKVVGASSKLGIAVRDAYRKGTGLPYSNYVGKNALNYRDDIGGLNLSTVPKILFESGNMRNPGEAAKFQDPQFRQKIALALANGLQHYLNT
jgi:N-acetylmuramoyl-L-alanine amidase